MAEKGSGNTIGVKLYYKMSNSDVVKFDELVQELRQIIDNNADMLNKIIKSHILAPTLISPVIVPHNDMVKGINEIIGIVEELYGEILREKVVNKEKKKNKFLPISKEKNRR